MSETTGLRETLTDRERVTAMSAAYPDDKADLTWAEIEELLSPGSGEQVSEAMEPKALDAARELIDAFCNKALGTYPPATQRDKLATDILALSASMAGPDDDEAEPHLTGRGWENLTCDDQYALARRIASNVGYVLVPEPSIQAAEDAPTPAPEAKPVASPAEGEADTKFLSILANDPNAVHINLLRGSLARPSLAQIIHIYGADALREALAGSPDREAATREAVIEEAAKICDAVRPRLSAGRSRRLNQMDEHVASVADSLASRIRALAQQAKPQQEKI